MRVLTISVDVSDLSDTQIEELQLAMEVQTEDYDSLILNSTVNELDEEDLLKEDKDETNLH